MDETVEAPCGLPAIKGKINNSKPYLIKILCKNKAFLNQCSTIIQNMTIH